MVKVQDVKTPQEFDAAVASGTSVVHFWAAWCEPCTHMDEVLATLASEAPASAHFLRVEAEEVDDLAERFDVSAVPHFVILKDGKVAAAVEGADAAALTSAVTSHLGGGGGPPFTGALPAPTGQLHPAPPPKREPPPEAQGPIVQQNGGGLAAAGGSKAALTARIEKLLKSAPILLFMKGSPDAPRCGFSAQVVQALRAAGADFSHFDILQDHAVREGLKEYSNWPTFPQLYVNQELLGGCDIVLEMAADGELKEALAAASPQQNGDNLQQRLKQLTTKAPVMLFIKGSRQQPFCRFSKAAVAAVENTGVPFETFDIFTDEAVREGLKKYSNWPTYPQLYVSGELLGGADIIAEMAESGELAEALAG